MIIINLLVNIFCFVLVYLFVIVVFFGVGVGEFTTKNSFLIRATLDLNYSKPKR